MNIVKVKKNDLIKVLEENKKKHVKDYEHAIHGYKIQLHKQLLDKLEKLSNGDVADTNFKDLYMPESHENDYDVVIGMLGVTEEKIIELTQSDYRAYYLDDWTWRRSWVGLNAGYIGIGSDSPNYSFEIG